MATVEQSIDIDVPVRVAYDQWTQFEEFPQFMDGVEEVRQIDDTHLHWRASIGGHEVEWDAVITEQIPDERVAWKATDGRANAGVVTFHRLGDDSSRVMVQIEHEAEGVMEKVGSALGSDSRQVKSSLARFKELVEERGRATGAWRGEVDRGEVKVPLRRPRPSRGYAGVRGGAEGSRTSRPLRCRRVPPVPWPSPAPTPRRPRACGTS